INPLSKVFPAANAPATFSGGRFSQTKNAPFLPPGSLTTRGARSRNRLSICSTHKLGGSHICASASIILYGVMASLLFTVLQSARTQHPPGQHSRVLPLIVQHCPFHNITFTYVPLLT